MENYIDIQKFPFQPFDVIFNETTFDLKLKPCSREYYSWDKELIITAEKYKNVNKPIFLSLSGGIDSEVMAMAFIKAGVPFVPFILEYFLDNEVINNHDISYALDFCKKNNLTPFIKRIDPNIFIDMAYDKKYKDYDNVIGVYQYIQLYIIEAVEELGGMVVLGSGIQMWRFFRCELRLMFYSSYFNSIHYISKNNLCHWPTFFWTTPELIRSYLDLPVVQQSLKNPEIFRDREMFETIKKEAYHSVFPNLERRQKYHGYENFYNKMPRYKNWIDREICKNAKCISISYPELLDQLKIKNTFSL
jgi:hypothetical protein